MSISSIDVAYTNLSPDLHITGVYKASGSPKFNNPFDKNIFEVLTDSGIYKSNTEYIFDFIEKTVSYNGTTVNFADLMIDTYGKILTIDTVYCAH